MSIPQSLLRRKPSGGRTTVYVERFERPGGTRYAVTRRLAANTIVYDEQDHVSEFAAYLAAATVANQSGARLDVPPLMKLRLVAYWQRRGRHLFYADQPRAACTNKYERQAYDLAEAEMMAYIDEKDAKPGLTDYVPMTVNADEYGYEVAA